MNIKIQEKVSVNFLYNQETDHAIPRHIKWKQRVYTMDKIGLHYTLYRGNTLIHMFAASDKSNYFLLAFNTKTLQWTLEEMAPAL